jgi:hypothetical protein
MEGGLGQGHLGVVGLHVHGHVDEHRPRPAAQHLVEGPLQHVRQLVDAAGLPVALDDRLHHAREVGPLRALDLRSTGPRM